jgi:predicted PurR-regulated permease PerM
MVDPRPPREVVPVRTILATIALIAASLLALLIVRETARVLSWILIAVFFAVAICPAVDRLDRRFRRLPRSMATLAVFLLVLAGLAAVITAIVVPLTREGPTLARDLPGLLADARAGKGPAGELLVRLHAADWLQRNQARLTHSATVLGTSAVRATITGLVATVTIFTLSFLMVLQGPRLFDQGVDLLSPAHAARVRRVGAECARTITGYVSGNLLISGICGTLTYALLHILGVPFPGLIALFVAITDLVPLVGAAVGAVVAVLAGFTQSPATAIVVAVFFVIYQQVENHLLQPVIYSRAVSLNPLAVLIAVLVFGELAGVLGALLAVPAAGIIQALLRESWRHHSPTPADSASR